MARVRWVASVEVLALAHGHNQHTLGVRLQLPENTLFYTQLGYHVACYGSHPGFNQPAYTTMFINMVKKLHSYSSIPGLSGSANAHPKR
jgi:hypothetical protein